MGTRDRHRSGSRPQPLRPCSWPIEQLPGLSQEDQTRLRGYDIHTTQQLLQQAATPAQKQHLYTSSETAPSGPTANPYSTRQQMGGLS